MGEYLGALASSTVSVGAFGAYVARMTGQMMDQYAREVEDFRFVPIRNFHRREGVSEAESRDWDFRVADG